MKCEELVTYLSDYIDDNLSEALTAAAREHLATCQNCSVVLDSTQRTIALYKAKQQQQHLPPARHDRLYAQIAAAFAESGDDAG